MSPTLSEVSIEERHVLERLLQLCLHDYSEHESTKITEDGRFEYRWLDHYWKSAHRFPYFIRCQGKLAGFVLVRSQEPEEAGDWDWQIAEFFILRGFRRDGIGAEIARTVLASKPGVWEISFETANRPACRFWEFVAKSIDSAASPTDGEEGRKRFLLQTPPSGTF